MMLALGLKKGTEAMKRGEPVTLKKLNSAALSVQGELAQLGLWNLAGRLHQTEIVWCPLPFVGKKDLWDAMGVFLHAENSLGKLFGYHAGHIYIPKWIFSQGLWAQERGSLRDVLRHEYAHAIAHYYPLLTMRSRRFEATFGGRYDLDEPVEGTERDYISAYAQDMPCEDYAETFMFYVRLQGRLPVKFRSASIKRKWKFVAGMIEIISSDGCKWKS